MKRILSLFLLALAAVVPIRADTRDELLATVASELPTNGGRGITAANLRTTINGVIESAFISETDGTPVVTGTNYSDPSWLTSLSWSKIAATPTTLAGYGIADGITAAAAASADAVVQAAAVQRTNHTGVQAIATVTGLQDALDAKASADLSNAAARGVLNARQWLAAMPPKARRTVMASPPTVTLSTSSQISSSIHWAPQMTNSVASALAPSFEFYTFSRGNRSAAVSEDVSFDNVTISNTPTYGGVSFCVSFFHTGTDVEIVLRANSTQFLVKVDDEYVSLTPTTLTSGSGRQFYRHAFGSSARRRIDVIGYNATFSGVYTGPTDTIEAAPIRGPRMIVLGDSFASAQPAGLTTVLADTLGWDDIWGSGLGGTGYFATASGTLPTFRGRVAHDVIAYAPDIVLVFGSINDAANPAVGTEAALLFSQITTALPHCLIVAGVNQTGGVNRVSPAGIVYKNAIKSAVLAVGGIFLDLFELPMRPTGVAMQSTTLKASYSAGQSGATGIWFGAPPKIGGTYEIGGTERVLVRGVSQVNGTTWNATFEGALQGAQVNGGSVVRTGGSLWTGVGYVGATTGIGNSDVLVGSDGTHPTAPGHVAIGSTLAALLADELRDRAN